MAGEKEIEMPVLYPGMTTNPYTIHRKNLMSLWYEKYHTFNPATLDDVIPLAAEWVNSPAAYIWDNKKGQEQAAIMEAAALIATKLLNQPDRAKWRKLYRPQDHLYHPQ